ncbi:hypothetical protein R3W88_015402 [Solanum pinnatisectum]|uniref:S-protein homolog n=1 Tax=Solanum pinnatisectum TaxID=50273 RepID=A0AAV9KWR7_9SOLN|nr:hypothetical protein R3W88_015402 [Solanum pinnatisectum]
MNFDKTFFILFITLYIFTICQAVVNDNGFQYEVHVIDALPNNNIPLKFHCFSGDDDLGFHYPKVGDDFHFKFRMNIVESTRFSCRFWWDNKEKAFDVFNRILIINHCSGDFPTRFCYWKVQNDGFYVGPQLDQMEKMYDWL